MSQQDPQQEYQITCHSPRKNNRQNQQKCCYGKNSVNTVDTKYSWNSCEEVIQNGKLKVNTFKKLKEGYLQQKNNEGKVIRQKTLQSQSPTRKYTIERLDDAVTIFSENSPRSVKSSNLAIEESVIIMSGRDVQIPVFTSTKVKLTSPHQAELFKRRIPKTLNNNTKNHQLQKRKTTLIKICQMPLIVLVPQIGSIFYCEKQNFAIDQYHNIFNCEFPGVLKMFSVSKLGNCITTNGLNITENKQSIQTIVFYEPFEHDLTDHILSKTSIDVKQFLGWVSEIINTLIDLLNEGVYLQINPSSIVVINQTVKLILRPSKSKGSKRETIRSLGIYLIAHFKQLTKTQQGKVQKLKGLNIFSKMEINKIIQDLLKKQKICLIEVNEKINNVIQTY